MVVPLPNLHRRRRPPVQAGHPQRGGRPVPLPVALDLHHVEDGGRVFARMQAVPPPQPHLPPARVRDFGGLGRLAPGRGVLEREPLPVLGRPAAAGIRRRSPIQHPIPPQAGDDEARLPFQRPEKALVPIAAVGGHHRLTRGRLRLSLLTEAPHLLHAHLDRRLLRQEPAGRERRRPTGAPLDRPRQERVGVPGDDLRARAVDGIPLARRQGFRLAMGPEGGVQGEDGGARGRHLGHQQPLQGVGIDPAVPEGGVPARPLPPEHRRQAQLDEGGNAGMDQQRLEQLEERVPRLGEYLGINRLPELLQLVTLWDGGRAWFLHTHTLHHRAVRSWGEPPSLPLLV